MLCMVDISRKYFTVSTGSFCLKDIILKSGVRQSQNSRARRQIADNNARYRLIVAGERFLAFNACMNAVISYLLICDSRTFLSISCKIMFNRERMVLGFCRCWPYSKYHFAVEFHEH